MSETFDAILQETLETSGAPAIAAIVVEHDRIIEQGAIGVRRLGSDDRVTMADRWHIGSNGKAITATMCASLINEGKLRWDTRFTDVLPDVEMLPAYQNVTLEMLLSHRAGLAAWGEDSEYAALPPMPDDPVAHRLAFACHVLMQAPINEVGSEASYSNAGFCLAAMMAERVTGSDWASLVKQHVGDPLGITLGHGWPAHDDPNQPWGHQTIDGVITPHPPYDAYQLPPSIAPAGDYHLSLADYAKFVQMNLCAIHGYPTVLPNELLCYLHTPQHGIYALGWGVDRKEDGRTFSMHSGSADTFLALIILAHHRDRGIVMIMNCVNEAAEENLKDGFRALVAEYGNMPSAD